MGDLELDLLLLLEGLRTNLTGEGAAREVEEVVEVGVEEREAAWLGLEEAGPALAFFFSSLGALSSLSSLLLRSLSSL